MRVLEIVFVPKRAGGKLLFVGGAMATEWMMTSSSRLSTGQSAYATVHELYVSKIIDIQCDLKIAVVSNQMKYR